ncbi:MAG: radical SAM protein [Labilithrix sp.]|nr:radical SAM protein [Labilithrix sp.]MCW5813400.1 radical SAM protein [Labilithrix sp.]
MSGRRLPIAPVAEPAKRRRLPLADAARPVDEACTPLYAVWEITLACDLACRHCGSRAGKPRPDELTTAEALDLVAQMTDLGVKEVTLIGGEAYLRADWLDIVRAFAARGVLVNVTTGGRGFTLERARAARDAGVEGISVSVDGLRATHDRLRAVSGSFDGAMSALAHGRAVGLRLSANTQINQWNRHELGDLLELLLAQGITGWQPQLTAAMGRAADEDALLLEPWHLVDLFPELARLKARCDEADVLFWPGNSLGYYGPYEEQLRAAFPAGHRGACGAGIKTMGIEANGDVKGCPSLPTEAYVGANVRDASLRDIWRRSHRLRFTRDQTVADLSGFCATCYYANECRAGCNFTAHVLLGKIGDNPFCHHRALMLKEEGLRERVVRVAPAPGTPFDHGRFEIVREPWSVS